MAIDKRDTVTTFLQDVERAKTDWEKYVSIPFALAYDKAYENYNNTISAQAKSDATKAELLFLALTLVGGSAFTAIFGAAAVKAVARNITVAAVIRSRNLKLIQAAKMVRDTPWASFALGETVDAISKSVSGGVKAKLAEAMPVEKTITTSLNPNQLDLTMRYALVIATSNALDVASDLRDRSSVSASEASAVLSAVRRAPLMNPPRQHLYDKNLADAIELIMFLNLVMTRDKLVKKARIAGDPDGMKFPITVARNDIGKAPLPGHYPTSRAWREGGSTYWETVEVNDLGGTIDKRINDLHQKFFSRPLLGRSLTIEEIRAAYFSLLNMQNRYRTPAMLAA